MSDKAYKVKDVEREIKQRNKELHRYTLKCNKDATAKHQKCVKALAKTLKKKNALTQKNALKTKCKIDI